MATTLLQGVRFQFFDLTHYQLLNSRRAKRWNIYSQREHSNINEGYDQIFSHRLQTSQNSFFYVFDFMLNGSCSYPDCSYSGVEYSTLPLHLPISPPFYGGAFLHIHRKIELIHFSLVFLKISTTFS